MKFNRWGVMCLILIGLYLSDYLFPGTFSIFTAIIFWIAVVYFGYSLLSLLIYRYKRK